MPVPFEIAAVNVEEPPEQMVAFDALTVTEGSGTTVIVKLVEAPVQPLTTGITVIVPDIGDPLPFVVVKEILPEPFEASPIFVLLLIQLYVVPVTAPLKLTATFAPTQTVWFETLFTEGVGLTIIVNVVGVPEQPFKTGVTVIVAVIALVPALIAVKAAILPEPLAAKPMLGVLFVQLYIVELLPLKPTAEVVPLLQTI